MVGLVYLHRRRLAARIGMRAQKICGYSLATFGVTVLVGWLAGGVIADATAAAYTLDRPSGVPAAAPAPRLLGVLQLYVVLMLTIPAVAWLMRRVGPVVPAALSLGFYLAVQIMPGENLMVISSG